LNGKYRGIICIILAALCFSGMTAFVRLSGDLPSMQKALFRNLPAVVIAFAMLRRKGLTPRVEKGRRADVFGRCAAGTMGVVCNFYAIDHLVLADSNMLNKLSPFFAIIFSYFLLREKIKPAQAFGVAAAFAGALLIIKPTFANTSLVPSLIGACGGVCAGLAYTFVRRLGSKGEEGARIVFWFSVFSCMATAPFYIAGGARMEPWQFGCLMLAGLCGAGGQFSITRAYYYAPARELSVYDYTQVIFATVWGLLLFGQVPDVYSVCGYAVIIAAAAVMFMYNNGVGAFRGRSGGDSANTADA
jgi:drug/metabolite transporter (DMT)-like permease